MSKPSVRVGLAAIRMLTMGSVFLVQGSPCAAAEAVAQPGVLGTRLADTAKPLTADEMESIAREAFTILSEVPDKGLEASREGLTRLIAVRKGLEKFPGISENLLALRLQRLVDRAILLELAREKETRGGKELEVPFHPETLRPGTVAILMADNAPEEGGRVAYVLKQDCPYANKIRKKGVGVEQILAGKFMSTAELEQVAALKDAVRWPPDPAFTLPERKDYLLITTLDALDKARYARILGRIYTSQKELPQDLKTLWETIRKELGKSPPSTMLTGMTIAATHVTEPLPDSFAVWHKASPLVNYYVALLPWLRKSDLVDKEHFKACEGLWPELRGSWLPKEDSGAPTTKPGG